jgi:hypothetical protein
VSPNFHGHGTIKVRGGGPSEMSVGGLQKCKLRVRLTMRNKAYTQRGTRKEARTVERTGARQKLELKDLSFR